MRITNKLGLPNQLVRAIEKRNEIYEKSKTGNEHYSVTQLISPAYQTNLKIKHRNEIEEDVSDNIWMLFGSAMHSILENGAEDNSFFEERLSFTFGETIISGAVDYFTESLLQDYKVTSIYSIIFNSRFEEWTQQLNIYRYLIFKNLGYDIKKMQVVAILRDWSKTKALQNNGCPKNNVEVVDIPLWDYKKTESFIFDRIKAIENNNPCSSEEKWSKQTTYAVMKEGRKTAVKVCSSNEEAESFINYNKDKNKMYIEIRKGEDVRCKDYCNVNKFCEYYNGN